MARATASAATLEDTVQRALVRDLKQRGFRRSGPTFRRALAGCVQVVNVQAGRSSLEGRFTLNVGLFFPAAHAELRELRRWDPGSSGPTESQCTVRQRIGTLLGAGDRWWPASPGEIGRVADEVGSALRDAALPWRERCSDAVVARGEASGADAIALALVVGDVEDARRRARQELAEAPQAAALHAWSRARGLLA